jgi:hypothetical protein
LEGRCVASPAAGEVFWPSTAMRRERERERDVDGRSSRRKSQNPGLPAQAQLQGPAPPARARLRLGQARGGRFRPRCSPAANAHSTSLSHRLCRPSPSRLSEVRQSDEPQHLLPSHLRRDADRLLRRRRRRSRRSRHAHRNALHLPVRPRLEPSAAREPRN